MKAGDCLAVLAYSLVVTCVISLRQDEYSEEDEEVEADEAVEEGHVVEARILGLGARLRHHIPCSCEDGGCQCCASIRVRRLHLDRQGCIKFMYNYSDLSIGVEFTTNNHSVFSSKLSGTNPPPLCFPITAPLLVTACIQLRAIQRHKMNIQFCSDLQLRLIVKKVMEYNLDCVRIGSSGIGIVDFVPRRPSYHRLALDDVNVTYSSRESTILTRYDDAGDGVMRTISTASEKSRQLVNGEILAGESSGSTTRPGPGTTVAPHHVSPGHESEGRRQDSTTEQPTARSSTENSPPVGSTGQKSEERTQGSTPEDSSTRETSSVSGSNDNLSPIGLHTHKSTEKSKDATAEESSTNGTSPTSGTNKISPPTGSSSPYSAEVSQVVPEESSSAVTIPIGSNDKLSSTK